VLCAIGNKIGFSTQVPFSWYDFKLPHFYTVAGAGRTLIAGSFSSPVAFYSISSLMWALSPYGEMVEKCQVERRVIIGLCLKQHECNVGHKPERICLGRPLSFFSSLILNGRATRWLLFHVSRTGNL
jgi:hypothetical protein